LFQQRRDAAQNTAVEAVGKNRLQTVAHFDPTAAVLDGEEQHDPFVLAALTDTPLAEKRIADIFDLLAIQGLERNQSHLHAGGLFHLPGVGFQLRSRLRIQDTSEVADVALRLERFEIEGKQRGRKDA
jgi:hypothetical protein